MKLVLNLTTNISLLRTTEIAKLQNGLLGIELLTAALILPFYSFCIFQVGTDFASDRDFAALDFLDHDLLGDKRPERPYKETVDYGLEKLVLLVYYSSISVLWTKEQNNHTLMLSTDVAPNRALYMNEQVLKVHTNRNGGTLDEEKRKRNNR